MQLSKFSTATLVIMLAICTAILHPFYSYGQMNGVYSIGNNISKIYDFNTISQAFDSLRKVGVSGPVVLKIDSGYYNEVIKVGPIPNINKQNNIVLESASGDSSDVIIYNNLQSSLESVIQIDSVKYLTIRNITLKAEKTTGVSFYNGIVFIGRDADSISIFNNHIEAISGTGDALFCLIFSCKVAEIVNNRFLNGTMSIFDNSSNYPHPVYVKIVDNQLINFKTIGIQTGSNCVIFGNTIHSDIGFCGIDLSQAKSFIANNKIINTPCAISIIDNWMSTIYNNIVVIDRPLTQNHFVTYHWLSNSLIINNSAHIISGLSTSELINNENDFFPSDCELYNNILVNEVGSVMSVYHMNSIKLNNNILHWKSTDVAKFQDPLLDCHSLSDLFSLNICSNDLDSLPMFRSGTDLHLKFNQFAGLAKTNTPAINPPAGVTGLEYDFDNQPRNLISFSPGADAFVSDSFDLMPYYFISPKPFYQFPYSDSLKLVVLNAGLNPISNYNVKAFVAGNLFGQYSVQKTLQPNQTDTINLGFFTYPQQNFNIKVITNHASDSNPYNDTLMQTSVDEIIDLALDAIIFPSDSIYLPTPLSFQVAIRNLGNSPVNVQPLAFELGSQISKDTFFQLVYPNDTIVLTSTKLLSPFVFDTVVCAYISHNQDFNPANDSLCKYVDNLTSIEKNRSLTSPQISVFPNPTSDKISVIFNSMIPKNSIIEIFNSIGRKVYEMKFASNQEMHSIVIDMTDYANGIYFYQIRAGNQLLFKGKLNKI